MKFIKENIGHIIVAIAILVLAVSYLIGNRYKDTGKCIIDTWTSKVYEDGSLEYSEYKVGQMDKK